MSVHDVLLHKMHVSNESPVQYHLQDVSGNLIDVNAFIGKEIAMGFEGEIQCMACGRLSKKSFNQGYCYPCFKKLARCDMCIMKPETCHYHEGTCREPEWADNHCMQAHYVYLSNASGLKVGITRQDQLPIRWIDQGAIQGLPIYKVSNRYQAGLVEVFLGKEIKDKTNWRTMLKGDVEPVDLIAKRDEVHKKMEKDILAISKKFGSNSCEALKEEITEIRYPVVAYPEKINSYNLDKTASFSDNLTGIKGQYLIFEKGVINLRKFGSYKVSINVKD